MKTLSTEVTDLVMNDWFAVAATTDLGEGDIFGTRLLGENIVVWRSNSALHAWRDRCPHRGAALSLGKIRHGNTLVCPYHGWEFDDTAQCARMPAHPEKTPSSRQRATKYHTREECGLIWVCLGTPVKSTPGFLDADGYRIIVTGPYDVATSGPRVIENFLDMSHFAFVHADYLGVSTDAGLDPCDVRLSDDEILVTNAFSWQPRANPNSDAMVKVEYTYRVASPLTAILTKKTDPESDSPSDMIMLTIQPIEEEDIRVWTIMAVNYDLDKPDKYFQEFQDTIFLQDKAVLESQRPRRLPLDPAAECHQPADKVSIAYRRWLREMEFNYGVEL